MSNTLFVVIVAAVLTIIAGAVLMHHPEAHSALRAWMHSAH